eukprot:Colp12_sorted_trinity150504_noHs@19600
MGKLANPPSLIEYEKLRFLVMDAPTDGNLPVYMQEFKKYGVTDVVRVCDPTYSSNLLQENGIKLWELAFVDGQPPPPKIIDTWLQLVEDRFQHKLPEGSEPPCIAIHCVAGLGRAPVLVAVALMAAGLIAEDAVDLIRKYRKGAINSNQLRFLQKYKPPRRKKGNGGCIIS